VMSRGRIIEGLSGSSTKSQLMDAVSGKAPSETFAS